MKITNDAHESDKYEYLFRKNNVVSTFSEVKNMITNIQNILLEKEIDCLVTYVLEEDKYIIYTKKSNEEEIKNIILSLENMDINKIDIRNK